VRPPYPPRRPFSCHPRHAVPGAAAELSDPRLHLATVIISLQVIGQIGFEFQLSIAQILLSLGTAAVLEVAIAFRSKRVIMWPASALLTGNGVAFVLRVPGTEHGDWWSLRGWWIFVGTAAVSLLSKYVFKWRGEHVFNPSNIGLVLCFLVLGRGRATPLDFWWGPMSAWLALALALIVAGGFAILRRLGLLRVALGFWFSFAAGIGVLALSGHVMLARWHLGPISGFHFWWVLVTSPEVSGLPLLHDLGSEARAAGSAGPARIRHRARAARLGADRADDDRVREQGGSAQRARARLSRTAGAAKHRRSARPARASRRNPGGSCGLCDRGRPVGR
jgi:hypothetical protein